MFRIAICDDNKLQCEITEDMTKEVAKDLGMDVEILTFSTGEALLDHVERIERFQIYIMDIVLPGINGFDAAMKLRMNNDEGKIIFISASTDYILSSYDVRAFYYLLKPVDHDKFVKALSSAIDFSTSDAPDYAIKLKDSTINVKKTDIVYAQLYGKTVVYGLSNGKVVHSTSIRTSFKDAVSKLVATKSFSMSSVGEIVNLKYVTKVDAEGITLRDGTMLFPSKTFYRDFKNDFINYKAGK